MFGELVCQLAACLTKVEFIAKIISNAIDMIMRSKRVLNVEVVLVGSNGVSSVIEERASVAVGSRVRERSRWDWDGRREGATDQ